MDSAKLAPAVLYARKSEDSLGEAEAKNKHLETLSRSFSLSPRNCGCTLTL